MAVTTQETAATERVSMVWPAELKDQLRQLVGSRGMTGFTLDAVREKLDRVEDLRRREELVPPGPVVNGLVQQAAAAPKVEQDKKHLDPDEVAKLPLAERMAYARELIEQREGGAVQTNVADKCPECTEELVNGECWSCLPG